MPPGTADVAAKDIHVSGRRNKVLNRITNGLQSGLHVVRRRFGQSTSPQGATRETELQRLFISVHLPKTAGTSFVAALDTHFQTRLLKDYSDRPGNTPALERNRAALQASLRNADRVFANVDCIHGHFLPIKYLTLTYRREVKFITWMRNPVERLLSHFYHWKTYARKPGALRRRFVEEAWSIERFCLGSEVRNLYWQFFWGFPIDYFDFIGITEFYEDDLAYFSQHYLGASLEAKRLNVRNHGGYEIDPSFRSEIEAFHDRDMQLYRAALEKRLSRRCT
jgi:hypothetical protein